MLVPLIFLCVSSALTYSSTLMFALIAGFLWDAENTLAPFQATTEIDIEQVGNLKFGFSIILFGFCGFLVKLAQGLIPLRGILINTLLVLVIFHVYLCLEWLALGFVRGVFPLNFSVWLRIFYSATSSSFIAPVVLLCLGLLWKILRCDTPKIASGLDCLVREKHRP